ncbi:hypothetical protein D9M73_261250 [compost metagenome]
MIRQKRLYYQALIQFAVKQLDLHLKNLYRMVVFTQLVLRKWWKKLDVKWMNKSAKQVSKLHLKLVFITYIQI